MYVTRNSYIFKALASAVKIDASLGRRAEIISFLVTAAAATLP
jgi:hypothetical protein